MAIDALREVKLIRMLIVAVASSVILALEECNEELRKEAINLFKQLGSGKFDDDERYATVGLLAEILFPDANSSHNSDVAV